MYYYLYCQVKNSQKKYHLVMFFVSTSIPLHFKGRKVSYIGYATYYQIINLDTEINKITLDIYE